MPVSATPLTPGQSGGSVQPYSFLTTPGGGSSSPLNFQTINTAPVSGQNLSASPGSAVNLLANNAPQSLTSMLMPLYQQLFGAQSGSLASQYGQLGEQGMAQAQSNAQARGLTGSSIEAANIGQAQSSANQGYGQAYSSLLGNLVNSYAGAATQDIASGQQYYGNLAQALGQSYASQLGLQEFNAQLGNASSQANRLANSQQTAGIFGALGSIGGGAALGLLL